MTTHLSLQRMLLPTAQVSSLTTGSITLPGARGQTVPEYGATAAFDYIAQSQPSTNTVTFSNIPQTYRHLRILMSTRSSDTIGNITFNSTGSALYSEYNMYSYSVNTSSFGTISGANQIRRWGTNDGGVGDASRAVIDIYNYTSTTFTKSVTMMSHYNNDANIFTGGSFNSASAITSITLATGNSASGATSMASSDSFIILYGIKDGTAL